MELIRDTLLVVFAGVTVLQILIWALFPMRFVRARVPARPRAGREAVSVVICARNEAERLASFLPAVLQQHYEGEWEVWVVNDASTDHTATVLDDLARQFPRLNVLHLSEKPFPGKKYALEQGIKAARYNWIAVTDADCRPATPQWLSGMGPLSQPGIVLGYAPLWADNNSLLNRWARYETLYTALQYCSTTHAGYPFMGVGRNMLWHRSFFDAAGGFGQHRHIPGGDDDLFVNQAANGATTFLSIHPETYMYSAAPSQWGDWLRQKRRHIRAGKAYKTWHSLVLGGVAFTHAVHYGVGAILLLVFPSVWMYVLAGYMARMLWVWPVMCRAAGRFKEPGVCATVPLLDGVMALWLGAAAPFFLLLREEAKWK